MPQITDDEYEHYQKLRKVFLHLNPERFEGIYFICGEGGSKDSLGLPEIITVCPAYGADFRCNKSYKRVD